MKFLLALAFAIAFSSAGMNAASVEEATLLITKSGSVSFVGLSEANLTLPIPQEGIENVEVSGAAWKIVNGSQGNSLLLQWSRGNGGDYEARITVKSMAHYTGRKLLALSGASKTFSRKIRELAPTEVSFERAAEMTMFVHDYVTYDLNMTGEDNPADWVLDNKRGVCVEYANLLNALLQASNVETRYVLGYAYSSVEAKPVGHAWIEIRAEDGTWIGLDPTWNEAGYIDATHVATSYGRNATQAELFSYAATKASWKRNDEKVEMTSYKTLSPTSATLESGEFSSFGAINANVTVTGCAIVEENAEPCVTREGSDALIITNKTKEALVCNNASFAWMFNATKGRYSCSVKMHDQFGSVAEATVAINGDTGMDGVIKNIIAWIYSILGLK